MLIKVIMCELPAALWDFLGIVAYYFSALSVSSRRLPSTHLLCTLCSCFWEFVTFKSVLSLSPIIMAQTEICMRKPVSVSEKTTEEEAEEEERGKKAHRGREKEM